MQVEAEHSFEGETVKMKAEKLVEEMIQISHKRRIQKLIENGIMPDEAIWLSARMEQALAPPNVKILVSRRKAE